MRQALARRRPDTDARPQRIDVPWAAAMTNPRQLLDDYAAEAYDADEYAGYYTDPEGVEVYGIARSNAAPKAFAALRAVLADCDFLDACIADYKGYEIAAVIRSSITKALEAT